MRILVPLGTRPEIVKLAPVVHALRGAAFEVTVLATGQHYDHQLAGALFTELGFEPDVHWTLPHREADRVGTMLTGALDAVAEMRPDVVLLLGDTYTVPSFCLAARRFAIPVAHLEAGLRSHNPTSTEEVNRRVAGALASLHLAPTALAGRFLVHEGVPAEQIRVVGNPIIDVLARSDVRRRPPRERAGVVVTAHRATNVDDPHRLAALVDVVNRVADEVGDVTFPVHPRTRNRLEATGLLTALERPGVRLRPPVEWREMLDLVAAAKVVVTDSGGLQEEASWFGVPVVVLRRSTPRWEGVAAGTSVLVGLDPDRAIEVARAFACPEEQDRVASVPCPYGDGTTGRQVAELLADPSVRPMLRLAEPDFMGKAVPC